MPFVVLKFGGTSVSSAANWRNIALVVRDRLAEGLQPVVVHSALSKITDSLEALLARSLSGGYEEVLATIDKRHRDLARDLGIELPAGVERLLAELAQIAAGLALIGELSDRIRARVMSTGELMATELGAAFLNAQGIATTLVDARSVLVAEERKGATEKASILSATCTFDPDPALQQRFAAMGTVVLSQGFIASDAAGRVVLLGRGGSDTSGAYFAAKLAAQRLEIWTDVPGMFSANPRDVPTARLLKSLHYDEAQEIASNGAKVLHPRCILPVRQHGIPLSVHATQTPKLEGTVISGHPADAGARVKAIAIKKGITLVSMESPGMWHEVGFLSDAFAVFKAHGLSVDLVSTSETNVTVSLDPQANTLDKASVGSLIADLTQLCRVEVIGPCASLSLVGRNIRAIIHQLGDAFGLFEEQKIYLVSQAANDLNFTFVIDEDQGDRLVSQLHDLLIRATIDDPVMGPTWEQLYAPQRLASEKHQWWHRRREALLAALGDRDAAYVYDGATIEASAGALKGLQSLSRVFYALKANANDDVLRRIEAQGLSFECVSPGEVERVRRLFPALDPDRLLFTPNFAPRHEYAWALEQGVRLTVDNLYVMREWPELFRGREVFVRMDTGRAHGHHQHVRTAGVHSKFGVPLFEVDELRRAVEAAGATVVGLHAHMGSGNFQVSSWAETAAALAGVAQSFPRVRILDLGGGLGVPERLDQPPVDLAALDAALAAFKTAHPQFQLWMEPGRYLVASAGVLLARVTQLKGKGAVRYAGVATGMNSLIRPALYGAYHEIVNLTSIDQPPAEVVNVVGPICETGDQLGHERLLPVTREGDVLLIANAGAYGYAMSSNYNLRAPAGEVMI
ncbi:MAG: bifunctional aspartate kinase/diaminopimelate decarboxylase [Gammaproteobacteria bacterium]|nr:bifunctional aspartate kinase/diaminopimelate decarboxylase [Gammaproteobacteria bacterium]